MAVNEDFWQEINRLRPYNEELLEIYGHYDRPQINAEEQDGITMEKMEFVVASILTNLTGRGVPSILVPRSNRGTYATSNADMVVSLATPRSTRRFSLLLFTIAEAYKKISTGTYSTRRDVYYEQLQMYRSQHELDLCVEDLARVFTVPRSALHLTITSKGLIAGALFYELQDGTTVNVSLAQQGMLVPENIEHVVRMSSDARYILVVEKDATFQKIVEAQFHRTYGPAIIVTGKGYPDLPTRQMLFRMWVELRLPVLALTDADPYGLHIAAIYKFGAQSREEPCLTVPALVLLGVLPSEILSLQLPDCAVMPLTPTDNKKLLNLAYDMRICKNKKWVEQLTHQYESGYKAEIQSLAHIAPDYLTSVYLPTKLREGSWIS